MAEADHRIGIDVGGTKVVIALADGAGEILAESRFQDWASGDPAADLEMLAREVQGQLENALVPREQVACLGVSAPGPLDPVLGRVIEAPNVRAWVDVPVRARLEALLGIPVRLENDANAAALAEWRYGAGQGVRNLILLTMSTGIGGGFIFDDRLYRGARFQAGEVGHMPIVPAGRLCGCGMRGCWEAYVSGSGLAAQLREAVARGEARALLEAAGGDPQKLSAKHWVEALRAGDAYALGLREEYLEHVAHGLALLVYALDPQRILLGTMVRENQDLFLDEIRARLRARLWPSLAGVEVEPTALGARLPAYAALAVASLGPPESGA